MVTRIKKFSAILAVVAVSVGALAGTVDAKRHTKGADAPVPVAPVTP